MGALIRFFAELALLRRGPQDLPASSALLVLLAVLNVVIGTANGVALFGGVRAALGANLIDLMLALLVLFALLQLRGHGARWLQTAMAFVGLGALAGLIMLLVGSTTRALGVVEVAALVDLVLFFWLSVALGNVLRHAMEIPLPVGVVIVLVYMIVVINLVVRVFPPVSLSS